VLRVVFFLRVRFAFVVIRLSSIPVVDVASFTSIATIIIIVIIAAVRFLSVPSHAVRTLRPTFRGVPYRRRFHRA
jgi:hypothetical protein